MKDILNKFIESVKNHKEKIKKVAIVLMGVLIIGIGAAAGGLYTYAKSNINYSEKELEEVALKKIPGQVIKIKKEIEIEDAAFEYTFHIKDKENIMQEITLNSKNGAITDIERNDYDDNDRYDD